MGRNSLTKADLSEAIHRELGLPRAECLDLVQSVLDHIKQTLVEGDVMKLSSFGTFIVRRKNARVGRNPRTGVEASIPPLNVVTFRPSAILKCKLNDVPSSNHIADGQSST